MDLYFPLPRPEHVLAGEHVPLAAGLMLLKLAGQITFTIHDLELLCKDFAGYTMAYNQKEETFTAKLYTRPEEKHVPTRG